MSPNWSTPSIRHLLFGMLTLFSLVLATGGAIGLSKISHAQSEYRQLIAERSPGYIALARSQRHFQIVGKHLNHMLLSADDPSRVAALWREVEAEFGNFETRTGQYEKGNPDEKALADRNRAQHRAIEDGARRLQASLTAGDREAAAKIMRGDVDPAIDRLRDTVKNHVDDVLVTQKAFVELRDADFRSALMWLIGAIVAALGVGAFACVYVTRRVTNAIDESIVVAEQVTSGLLREPGPIQHKGTAETARLLQALAQMHARLHGLVQQIRASSDSIGTASAEISRGNDDLSGRTEQAASNLQQTASAMGQLTGTVQQTAESARTANQLASSAADVASRGGAVVAQVVATMDDIQASSRKIADIIGTIDGIAFQTNILALNAAVEAARAGEQGRGFAVVAAEVRSLASRSAEAAKEIKSLISASVEKVESGTKLVADAGKTMSEIVDSVSRVNDMISEITAAAAEQSAGLGSVNSSVAQLDQTTQQNAALVEQSAAAAESLKQQARSLADAVGSFRLSASN